MRGWLREKLRKWLGVDAAERFARDASVKVGGLEETYKSDKPTLDLAIGAIRVLADKVDPLVGQNVELANRLKAVEAAIGLPTGEMGLLAFGNTTLNRLNNLELTTKALRSDVIEILKTLPVTESKLGSLKSFASEFTQRVKNLDAEVHNIMASQPKPGSSCPRKKACLQMVAKEAAAEVREAKKKAVKKKAAKKK